ncbi:MAG TPA: GNAT family N-acetyltransferase [Acidimicrobiales bacterium]|nr:GNAT family N-acetyltransferase [Acidimicrobiales bacterium]
MTGGPRVRRATAADRPALWALNALPNVGETADPSMPLDLPPVDGPGAFADLADAPDGFDGFFVVEHDGRVVGMAGHRGGEVLRVRVHPAMRRRGVGRMLMDAVEADAAAQGVHRLFLDTATNQPEAVAFYEGLGYVRTGTESRPEWSWTLVYFERTIASSTDTAGTTSPASNDRGTSA